MRALVTGAAGFIGSQLAERLIARGAEVTGVDAFTDYYPRAVKESNLAGLRAMPRFRFVEAGLHEADLAPLLDGVTHVFHFAAQAGVRRSWGREFSVYTVNNTDATQRLLEACAGCPIDRFIYASSSSVYGDGVSIPMRESALPQPVSPYGVTKLAAEQLGFLYHVNHRVPVVSLRYFTVYGPRQRPDMAFHRFFRAALASTPISVYGDGEQTRDFTFVEDAVAATLAAGDRGRPGSVYNIGGGSRVSVNHVLELVRRVSGRQLEVRHEAPQKGDMRDTYADTSRARRDLGFEPRVCLEDGLRAEFGWLAAAPAVAGC